MTTSCQRARSLASQGLDRPLNELEERFLGSHTARCGACSAFRADVAVFTTMLRDAELEPVPVPWPAEARVGMPRRRVRVRALAQISSAAAVLVVTASVVLGTQSPFSATGESSAVAQGVDPVVAEQLLRVMRREALADHELQILPATAPVPVTEAGGAVKPALPTDGQ